jgi:hypothetical protein
VIATARSIADPPAESGWGKPVDPTGSIPVYKRVSRWRQGLVSADDERTAWTQSLANSAKQFGLRCPGQIGEDEIAAQDQVKRPVRQLPRISC